MKRSAILAWMLPFMPTLTQATEAPAPVAPKIGDRAPDLRLEGLLQAPQGAKATLDALRGHVVVLEFWATWCVPCVGAIPHMNELAEKFRDKPVRFIAITDEDRGVIDHFLKKQPLKAWIGLDPDRTVGKAFHARGLPKTVIINQDGLIAGITYPTRVDERMLNEILAGRQPKMPSLESQ